MSWPLVQYVLTAAVRDRLILSFVVLIALGISLSLFMGGAAIVEKRQFVLTFAGGGLRLVGIMGLVLFVVFHVRRSFEHKDVEFLLSRPIGRVQFLLSFAAAFSLLAVFMGLAVTGGVASLSSEFFSRGQMLWGTSMIMEFVIMVNVALFFSMWISSAAIAAMVTFGFYVLARMMGQILGILDHGTAGVTWEALDVVMQAISVVTPRLDLMGQTSWLLYGVGDGNDFAFVIMQGTVFTILVLSAALIDLVRRQF